MNYGSVLATPIPAGRPRSQYTAAAGTKQKHGVDPDAKTSLCNRATAANLRRVRAGMRRLEVHKRDDLHAMHAQVSRRACVS
jgi:hypothetical protein